MTREWKAGDKSWMAQYGFKDSEGKYHHNDPEFATPEEAMAEVVLVLGTGTAEQVSVIMWRHDANMPGCLPAVRASSCGMTVYRLVDGEISEKPIDIFGSAY